MKQPEQNKEKPMGYILMIEDAIRGIADNLPEGETVMLPYLPPIQWIDETMNDNEKHIKFIDCDLAEILHFIADMVE